MARPKPPGWWYPWILVAGMLVVVAVNAVMISYAVGTFPGLDTSDAYRKGLAYNQTLAAARTQEARGWRIDVRFAPAGVEGSQRTSDGGAGPGASRTGELVVRLVDDAGQALRGLVVTAALVRPTRAGLDLHVAFDERDGGLYAAAVALPLAGQWDAHVWARRGGDDAWQAKRRIIVR